MPGGMSGYLDGKPPTVSRRYKARHEHAPPFLPMAEKPGIGLLPIYRDDLLGGGASSP